MAEPTLTENPQAPPVPSSGATATTLIGPNGTAPGMSFIEQQERPVIDAQTGRAAGAPLAIAALLLLIIFTTIVVRAARAKRRIAPGRPTAADAASAGGSEPQL